MFLLLFCSIMSLERFRTITSNQKMHELTTNIDIIEHNNWKIFIKHGRIDAFSLFLNHNKIDLRRYLSSYFNLLPIVVVFVSIHNVQLRHCTHDLYLFSLSSLTRINQTPHLTYLLDILTTQVS